MKDVVDILFLPFVRESDVRIDIAEVSIFQLVYEFLRSSNVRFEPTGIVSQVKVTLEIVFVVSNTKDPSVPIIAVDE